MRNLLEEAALADELGLTVFGVGEHHRPDYLVSFVDLYRRAWAELATAGEPRLAVNTHAFVADTEAAADAAFAAPYLEVMNRVGRERGWPRSGRDEFEALKSARGSLTLGSPEQVAEKIVSFVDLLRPDRYLAHMSI